MVFRGLPSQGCEHCRRVKKRCSLERPACQRCVKQNRECVGYPTTTHLVFRDQSQVVRAKVERQKNRNRKSVPIEEPMGNGSHSSPGSGTSCSTTPTPSSSDGRAPRNTLRTLQGAADMKTKPVDGGANCGREGATADLSIEVGVDAGDVAVSYFMQQFTSEGKWQFLRDYARKEDRFPCLHLAVRACGMAALANVHSTLAGSRWAQRRYIDAVSLLNQALRDPVSATSDESLLVVRLLAYYENIACERPQSIQSWQAHLDGATQMLQMRGRRQFDTQTGRDLFCEMRQQIVTYCIWNDVKPPQFLKDFQSYVEPRSSNASCQKWVPTHELAMLSFDLADLRSRLWSESFADADAALESSQLEKRLVSWSKQTRDQHSAWRWSEVEVGEREDTWDGMLFMFNDDEAPIVWNNWRCIRVMLSRTQEMLSRRLAMPAPKFQQQVQHFRQVRRQMADEICATIPTCLGCAGFQTRKTAKLVSAYASIWPLFFAATCAFERAGPSAISLLEDGKSSTSTISSAACAQAAWVLGRLTYIADQAGLKWARGVTSPLRGRFELQNHALSKVPLDAWVSQVTTPDRSPWLQQVKGSRIL